MKTDNAKNVSSGRTTVFNLIILDESGSMIPVKSATISGCNETLNCIRNAAQEFPNLRQLVSIYAFQGGNRKAPSRYLIKNMRAEEVPDVRPANYVPWGNTPLLDAVGTTLTELESVAATHEDATGVVTIITDGEENSSTHYGWNDVARIVGRLKEMGWTINLIGANIDVEQMGERVNIKSVSSFEQTPEGTMFMMREEAEARQRKYRQYNDELDNYADVEIRKRVRRQRSDNFFEHPDSSKKK